MIEDQRTKELGTWLALLQGASLKRQVAKQIIQWWCVHSDRPLSAALEQSDAEIAQQWGLAAGQLAQVRAAEAQIPAQQIVVRELAKDGIGILTRVDSAYPESLVQHLPEDRLPYLLFYRGELGLLTQPSVSVLGSAAPSGEAQRVATDLAHRLVQCGHTLVGGYAKGIDRLVLDTARKERGPAIVVLPMGLHRFGRSHGGIEQGIKDSHVLLLSPFSPDAEASEPAALARLPLVTGLSDLVVLIELEVEPAGWPTLDLVKGAELPICIWRGTDMAQNAAWLEAGAVAFDDAGAGTSLVNRSMGLEEESATEDAGPVAAAPTVEPLEAEPLPFDDAESAIESLGRSGRVPDVLARRLRETHWDQ